MLWHSAIPALDVAYWLTALVLEHCPSSDRIDVFKQHGGRGNSVPPKHLWSTVMIIYCHDYLLLLWKLENCHGSCKTVWSLTCKNFTYQMLLQLTAPFNGTWLATMNMDMVLVLKHMLLRETSYIKLKTIFFVTTICAFTKEMFIRWKRKQKMYFKHSGTEIFGAAWKIYKFCKKIISFSTTVFLGMKTVFIHKKKKKKSINRKSCDFHLAAVGVAVYADDLWIIWTQKLLSS